MRRLLEQARLRASEENEWDIVCLLHEAHGYATGRILKPDFDERYRLIKDSKRKDSLQKLVAGTLSRTLKFINEAGNDYLVEQPGAGLHDLLTRLRELGDDAQLLDAPEETPGRYRLVRGRAELMLWLQRVLSERIDIENPGETAQRIAMSSEKVEALAKDPDGQAILKATELKQRSDTLTELRKLVDDPTTGEEALQELLQHHPWIFGGRFVDAATRRRLVDGEELDIPLIRADGSLHIVELKRSLGVSGIIKRHRNAWVPTAEVHNAVGRPSTTSPASTSTDSASATNSGSKPSAPARPWSSATPSCTRRSPSASSTKPCAPSTPTPTASKSSPTPSSSTTPHAHWETRLPRKARETNSAPPPEKRRRTTVFPLQRRETSAGAGRGPATNR
ncbi:hypothetical protein SAMN04487905_11241 [Actinopolyspora xinjiangensis]|uniref:Uncharacterized protein n=1 Tax=Actinopolyspora xinjiangensis TaxID=405564 RepID=A0A1H0WGE2_9ACTN|nr:hypothetical protein SAMN04487905_11241 [Actinopolyspora xinjiangensis]